LFEVRDATRPISACEMVLIRLAYACELPPTDKLVRDLLDNNALSPRGAEGKGDGANKGEGAAKGDVVKGEGTKSSGARGPVTSAATATRLVPQAAAEGAPSLRSLQDIVALCEPRSELRVNLEHHVHLVRLEPGLIEIRPTPRAPRTLANDLQQKLRQVTGERWSVSIASQGGEPTLAEQKKAAHVARLESVMQEPMVRAVFDRFPGSEIVAVREKVKDEIAAAAAPESDE
jgi:DNA polymerase-3 subunit gamma/tau